jgi:ABC-type multidrug transport system fused ATPase/permease subunit
MSSSFFSTASIGSVSTVILFLMTFLPYIVIISLGATLSSFGKFLASLSLSTAFCYAWHYIFRTELQEQSLTFSNAFDEHENIDNDLKFGLIMIVIDTVLYATIGYLYQKYSSDDFRFVHVERKNIDKDLGAEMRKVSKIYEGCDPNKPAVDNVSINFKKNQILMLLGRNGAGKP